MKGVTSKVSRLLSLGTKLLCTDNSGAKELYIISGRGFKGTRKRNPRLGVGDLIVASVRKGKPDMIKKVVKAVIVRQKKEIRRANGIRVMFEDNAAVLVNDESLPVATEIKGVVAREIAERYPKIAAISAGIV